VLENNALTAAVLDALWQEALSGTRRFKLYRQMKCTTIRLNPDLSQTCKE